MQYVPNLNVVISLSLISHISKALTWQLPSCQPLQLRAMGKKNDGWLCAYSIEVSIVMSTKFTSTMRVSEVISNEDHVLYFLLPIGSEHQCHSLHWDDSGQTLDICVPTRLLALAENFHVNATKCSFLALYIL